MSANATEIQQITERRKMVLSPDLIATNEYMHACIGYTHVFIKSINLLPNIVANGVYVI